jgi:hypothetical protein
LPGSEPRPARQPARAFRVGHGLGLGIEKQEGVDGIGTAKETASNRRRERLGDASASVLKFIKPEARLTAGGQGFGWREEGGGRLWRGGGVDGQRGKSQKGYAADPEPPNSCASKQAYSMSASSINHNRGA